MASREILNRLNEVIEDAIEEAAREHDFSSAIEEAVNDYDLEGCIRRAVNDFDMEDEVGKAIENAVDSYDFDDAVGKAVEDADIGSRADDAVEKAVAEQLPAAVRAALLALLDDPAVRARLNPPAPAPGPSWFARVRAAVRGWFGSR